MPASLHVTNGAAWQLAQRIANGNATADDRAVDRLADAADLDDTARNRLYRDVSALKATVDRVGTGTHDARQAGADLADRWHDRIGDGRPDPLRHEMDPAKLAAAGTNHRW